MNNTNSDALPAIVDGAEIDLGSRNLTLQDLMALPQIIAEIAAKNPGAIKSVPVGMKFTGIKISAETGEITVETATAGANILFKHGHPLLRTDLRWQNHAASRRRIRSTVGRGGWIDQLAHH